jgi:hypothetical protein
MISPGSRSKESKSLSFFVKTWHACRKISYSSIFPSPDYLFLYQKWWRESIHIALEISNWGLWRLECSAGSSVIVLNKSNVFLPGIRNSQSSLGASFNVVHNSLLSEFFYRTMKGCAVSYEIVDLSHYNDLRKHVRTNLKNKSFKKLLWPILIRINHFIKKL